MEQEDRGPTMEQVLVIPATEASLRLQVTDLLLGRPHDIRTGWSPLGQSEVLQQIEAALETYLSYFYPSEYR